jgi:gliding motility-associated protein GldE
LPRYDAREEVTVLLDDIPLSLAQGIVLICLFACSAFFSGSETALFSIPKFRLRKFREQEARTGRRIAQLLDRPNRLLATLLTGNMIVNVLASAILGVALERVFHQSGFSDFASFALAVIAMTVFILVFGEISPKVFALRNPEKTASFVAPLIEFIELILAPVGRLLLAISGFLLRISGAHRLKIDPFVTEEELETMVSLGERQGLLHREERRMIEGIMDFADTTVKEVLVPRTDIRVLRQDVTVSAALALIRQTGFSRIPVFGQTIDDILGVLYAKDLLLFIANGDTQKPIRDLLRDAYFVPENKKVAELLNEFRHNRVHCAIVVDEHGGTVGLVTLEDLLEEIVGEIQDERDVDKPLIEKVEPEGILIDARVPLDELTEIIGSELRDQEHESVGGFILSLMGRMPKKGENVKHDGMTFVVDEVSERRILKVKVIPAEGAPETDNDRKE